MKQYNLFEASEDHLRDVFGGNFFGSQEWEKLLSKNFPSSTKRNIGKSLFDLETVKRFCPFSKVEAISKTHLLFLGMPLTLLEWKKLAKMSRISLSRDPVLWFSNEAFATKTECRFGWYLSPLFEDPRRSVPLDQEAKCVPKDYRIATVVEEAAKHLIYRILNGRFIECAPHECSERTTGGYRICIEGKASGFEINNFSQKFKPAYALVRFSGIYTSP